MWRLAVQALQRTRPMVPALASTLRDRRVPVAVLAALVIAAVACSRIVLRSERELALAAGALPYLVAGVIGAVAVRWMLAAGRGRFHALSSIELALTSCIVCVCVGTLAMPRAPAPWEIRAPVCP